VKSLGNLLVCVCLTVDRANHQHLSMTHTTQRDVQVPQLHRVIIPAVHKALIPAVHRALILRVHRALITPVHKASILRVHRALTQPQLRATMQLVPKAVVPPQVPRASKELVLFSNFRDVIIILLFLQLLHS
jgi:hypothetical protein